MSDEMRTVYLCGPINGLDDANCKAWREKAKLLLKGFVVLDPMRRDYRGREEKFAADIIRSDKADIDASDALLVYFDRPSFGTAMEIFYAYLGYKKIVAVNVSGLPTSPWVAQHVDQIATTIEDGCKILETLLAGENNDAYPG